MDSVLQTLHTRDPRDQNRTELACVQVAPRSLASSIVAWSHLRALRTPQVCVDPQAHPCTDLFLGSCNLHILHILHVRGLFEPQDRLVQRTIIHRVGPPVREPFTLPYPLSFRKSLTNTRRSGGRALWIDILEDAASLRDWRSRPPPSLSSRAARDACVDAFVGPLNVSGNPLPTAQAAGGRLTPRPAARVDGRSSAASRSRRDSRARNFARTSSVIAQVGSVRPEFAQEPVDFVDAVVSIHVADRPQDESLGVQSRGILV